MDKPGVSFVTGGGLIIDVMIECTATRKGKDIYTAILLLHLPDGSMEFPSVERIAEEECILFVSGTKEHKGEHKNI